MSVPNDQGTREIKEITVSQSKPAEKSSNDYGTLEFTHSIRYKYVLPTYIYEFLKGKKYLGPRGFRNMEDFSDLKKSVSNTDLTSLLVRINYLFRVFVHMKTLTLESKSKRIWFVFECRPDLDRTSSYNSAKVGSKVYTNLWYAVGYEGNTSKKIFDTNFKRIDIASHKEYSKAISVEWTQEREDRLKALLKDYQAFGDKAASFFMGLTEQSFDLAEGPSNPLLSAITK